MTTRTGTGTGSIAPRLVALSLLLPLVPLALAASGCGAAEAARPREQSFAEVSGASSARFIDRTDSPFIIDWEPAQHAALDAAMQKGVVVVAYDGAQIKLLPDCRLKGSYGASSVTLQSGKLTVKSRDAAGAEGFPVPVVQSVSDARAGMNRGASLDFEYAIGGKREANRTAATRAELNGPAGTCRGASHFLHSAFVGAYRRIADTSASVHAGGTVLGVGASADSSSARTLSATGGDLEACRRAASGVPPQAPAPAPVPGGEGPMPSGPAGASGAAEPSAGARDACSVPLKLELRPIAPAVMVQLTLASFSIETTDADGSSWDTTGSPDPQIYLANGLGFEHRTQVYEEQATAAPSLVIESFELNDQNRVAILVKDDDEPLESELIGVGQVTLAELRAAPQIDVELKKDNKVTGRLRLSTRIDVLPVPVP